MIKGWCAAVVVFNRNDVRSIIVDVDVETIFGIALQTCTCGVSADGRQCCCQADSAVAIEVLVEINFVFGDAAPGGV